jgi:RimJ/RimL family protein N-acetyltransferase
MPPARPGEIDEMQALATPRWPELRDWLVPEQPCSLIAWHTLATGIGRCWVDRLSRPRCAIAFAGGNLTLAGDAAALSSDRFAAVVDTLLADWERVFIAAPNAFANTVVDALAGPARWPRVIFTTDGALAPKVACPPGRLRRLGAVDTGAVEALEEDIQWISDTLDGPARFAQSGTAFGGFVDGRLISVAVPFYVGERFEELGVVTAQAHRGVGWSTACSAAVIADIQSRDRTPCWSTTPDNTASMRVASKLGFRQTREEMHFMVGEPTDGALPPD